MKDSANFETHVLYALTLNHLQATE